MLAPRATPRPSRRCRPRRGRRRAGGRRWQPRERVL